MNDLSVTLLYPPAAQLVRFVCPKSIFVRREFVQYLGLGTLTSATGAPAMAMAASSAAF
ncbi:unknown [Bacteroides sp. CAG:709]|nr:unknown [Bacteroides sp. CAG:709]